MIVVDSGDSFNEIDALSAVGVPVPGAIHPSDFFLICKSVTARQDDGEQTNLKWVVTANYDNEPDDQEEENEEGNPLEERPVVRGGSIDRETIVTEDADGEPIQNSAEDPIRGLTVPYADYAINISMNVATLSLATVASFRKKVNDATFFDADAGTARLSRFDFDVLYHQSIGQYFKVSYEFQIREGGWDARVLDEGFNQLDYPDKTMITLPLLDDTGAEIGRSPVTEPVLLNGFGTPLEAGDPPVFLEFTLFTPADFSGLGIPTAFSEI